MTNPIRVVIVDDHPIFREGVMQTLRAELDFEIVGQAATADEAVRLAVEQQPDILLLDIGIPGNGIKAAEILAVDCPAVKMVLLTRLDDEDTLMAGLRLGARAYILKGVAARELISILRNVAAGQIYVNPALAASLLVGMSGSVLPTKTTSSPWQSLNGREREVLELVAAGLSNKEVGQRLGVTEKSVKHSMTAILQKLGARNRTEAALMVQNARQYGTQARSAADTPGIGANIVRRII